MDYIFIFIPILSLIFSLYIFIYGVKQNKYSSLYWFSVIAVFTGPVVFDKLFGVNEAAFTGLFGAYYIVTDTGINLSILFAFLHIIVTILTYFALQKFLNNKYPLLNSSETQYDWLKYSNSSVLVFGFVFLVSCILVIYRRWDLTLHFADFLEPDSSPLYEIYFYFASTPIMVILMSRKGLIYRYLSLFTVTLSVAVAYFLGVRYYMFPFLGFFVWIAYLKLKLPIARKIAVVVLVGTLAWILFSVWGIIRGLDIRDDPMALFNISNDEYRISRGWSISDEIVQGNEFSTRLAYYDLFGRFYGKSIIRGLDEVKATLLSAIYPFLLRIANIEAPISNAKFIYEVQRGIFGTGRSVGTTVFGNDWFTWGWWGIPIGGITMGFLLAIVDWLYKSQGFWWSITGPMWSFQLIFFARGGTDVWLGLWGRYIPIALILVLAVWFFERVNHRNWTLFRKRSKVQSI